MLRLYISGKIQKNYLTPARQTSMNIQAWECKTLKDIFKSTYTLKTQQDVISTKKHWLKNF